MAVLVVVAVLLSFRLRRVCPDCKDMRQFHDITARWPLGAQ